MSWLFNGLPVKDEDIPKGSVGFIYKITHEDGRWYLGRKLLTKAKQKVVNGKKKKTRVESDWRDYWSSNDELKEEAKIAPEKLKREILLFCSTNAQMLVAEEYLLHVSGAIFDKTCFNNNIRAKIFSAWFVKTPDFFETLKNVKYK